jgi:chloramphenicol-sensitive protein RarD
MTRRKTSQKTSQTMMGLFCAITAYLIWGLSPIFYKALGSVPAFEILLHRIVWSFLFLIFIIIIFKRTRKFKDALKNRLNLLILSGTTLLIAGNWFLFIWAINHDNILQTSLGYFICPLVSVLIGTVLLKERLRPLQIAAVIMAVTGVFYLTLYHGKFPWIALALALSFAFYGFVKKIAPVDALEGLAVETLLLSLPAAAYIYYLDYTGSGVIFRREITTDLLLMGTALVTAFPLLFFTIGARRLQLVTVGFLQYIAPSGTFLLAVFIYEEPFARVQVWTFIMVWAGLAVFSLDAFIHTSRLSHLPFEK